MEHNGLRAWSARHKDGSAAITLNATTRIKLMNRQTIGFLILIIAFIGCFGCRQDVSPPDYGLRNRVNQFFTALENGDVETLQNLTKADTRCDIPAAYTDYYSSVEIKDMVWNKLYEAMVSIDVLSNSDDTDFVVGDKLYQRWVFYDDTWYYIGDVDGTIRYGGFETGNVSEPVEP